MSKHKEDDYFFGEGGLIAAFGKEMVEKIKKENPEMYARLRNSPCFMPSDVARDADDLIETDD
ncbi:MAG: hypothetical protein IKL79_01220 [Clostridia bacterium]|nr:hypothetical protein [Clostridia bacterium]